MSKVFDGKDRDGRTVIESTGNQKRSLFGFIGGDQYKGTRKNRDGSTVSARGDNIGELKSRLGRGRRRR